MIERKNFSREIDQLRDENISLKNLNDEIYKQKQNEIDNLE